MKSVEERFWEKVDKSGDCWLWTASCFHDVYGQFKLGGKMRRAHRVAFELDFGPIPEGKELDHLCFNRNCVRLNHLRPVTRKENRQHLRGADADNISGIRGVSWYPRYDKYLVRVGFDGKTHHVGYYSEINEAEKAAISKRNELFTHDDHEEWKANNG